MTERNNSIIIYNYMSYKKNKKWLFSSIFMLLATSTISSSIYVLNVNKYEVNKNTETNNNKLTRATESISFKLKDIVDSYQAGFVVHSISEIVVAVPSSSNNRSPDLSKVLFKISLNDRLLTVSNNYNTNQSLWDERIDYKNNMMTSPSSYNTPNTDGLSQNYFKLSEYNQSTSLAGTNNILWDSNNSQPTNLSGTRSISTTNAFLLQMSIENIDSVSSNERAQIFINKGTIESADWDIPNSSHGWSGASGEYIMEGFFVNNLETNSVQYYAPNTGVPSIGTWSINNNDVTKSYLSLPIQVAFEQLKQNPSDISEIVNFKPSLLLPSMADFNVVLNLNYANNRLEFNYGDNNNFKYIFNAVSKGSSRHIFPFYFDTSSISPPVKPGVYINVKENFEAYSTNVSIISGFTKGTYIIPLTWALDKNRYPSQVTEEEIKQLAIDHIGNAPSNLTTNDIIINQSNNFITNNSNGQVSFNIILKRYINDNGEEVNNNYGLLFEPRQVISGFKQIAPTSFNSNHEIFNVNKPNEIATNQTADDIKQIIVDNRKILFTSLASDIGGNELTVNDVDVNIISSSNSQSSPYGSGYVEAKITIKNNFLSEPYALISKPSDIPIEFKIILTGYKTLKTTIIYDNVHIQQTSLLASDQTEADVLNLVLANPSLFIRDYPEDLNLSTDFKINKIITKNNLGDPDIYNGNFGYLVANVTITKINNSLGEIEYNKTYNLTISGYKKITPTKINTSVTIPNMSNTLITNIINNESDIVNLITRNQTLFFSNTSLPSNYADYITVQDYTVSNTNSTYQLRAVITLKTYYNSQGILVKPLDSSSPLTATLFISGFKVINPTLINAGTYIVAAQYQSAYASTISISTLKEIIIATQGGVELGSIITGSRPDGFSVDNLLIYDIRANNISGTLRFDLNINLRYDDQGNLSTEPFATNYSITLTGFQISEPTRPTQTDPLVVTSNYDKLVSQSVSVIRSVINKHINNEVLTSSEQAIIDQLKLFLWSEGFTGYKDPFELSHISIIQINSWSNLDGTIQLSFSLNRYMDSNGDIIEQPPITIIRTISGFYKITPTSINKQQSWFTVPLNLYGYVTPSYIVENNLIPDVIKNYDAQYDLNSNLRIILGDLPPDFDYNKNLIITNVSIDDTYATISFDLSINYYYNSVNGEIVTPDNGFALSPVRIQLRGFRTIPSTLINGIVLTQQYFYPTEYTATGRTLIVNMQDKSSLKFITSEGFVSNINKTSKDPTEVVQEYLNSIFYYSNSLYEEVTASQPLVVYNPQPNKSIEFDAIVVNSMDNISGTINITARAKGYYYNQSNEATQIINVDGGNYAYIDIQINGFLLEIYRQFYIDNLFIILAATIPGLIICIFFLSLIIWKMKSNKRKKGSNIDEIDDLLIKD